MIGLTRQILFKGKHSVGLLPILSSSRFWFASKTVSLPFLTDSINQGTIKSFDRKEGQWINKDEPIANVQTQKVTVTVRSPHSGLVTKCHVKVGDKLQVGNPLFDVDPDAKKPQQGQKSSSQQTQTQSGHNAQNADSSAGSGQSAFGQTMSPNTSRPPPYQNAGYMSQSGQVGAGQGRSQFPNLTTTRINAQVDRDEIKPRSGQQPPLNTVVPPNDKDMGPIPKQPRPGESSPDPGLKGPSPTQTKYPSDKIFDQKGDKPASGPIDKPTDKPFGENLNDSLGDKPSDRPMDMHNYKPGDKK